MKNSEVKSIIEALLFASPDPLHQAKVNTVFTPETYVLKDIIDALNKQYLKENHAFEIQQVAGGFQLVSKKEYEIFIRRMLSKSGKLTLSNAALDCLAIIAYRQPISRYEIEAVRGVDSSGVIKTLLGRELIKIKGRDEIIMKIITTISVLTESKNPIDIFFVEKPPVAIIVIP